MLQVLLALSAALSAKALPPIPPSQPLNMSVTVEATAAGSVAVDGLSPGSSRLRHAVSTGDATVTFGRSWIELRYPRLTRLRDMKWISATESSIKPTLRVSVDGENWRPMSFRDAVGSVFHIDLASSHRESLAFAELIGQVSPASPADAVNIFMGTSNDGPRYSRGNQYPGVHTPFGMNAFSVGTANLQDHWFYDFKDDGLTGIKLTHQPTVWGEDFGALDFMPTTGAPTGDYDARRSPYQRANEVARPYYYRNILDRYGIAFEFAPSDRGAVMRFHYPADQTAFLSIGGAGARYENVTRVDGHTIAGYLTKTGTTVYFQASFDQPILTMTGGPDLAAGLEFTPGATVVMRMATSYISAEQAAANLTLEVAGKSLEDLAAETKARWEHALGRLEVSGGTAADQMTFYSALYRLYAFPKMHWEPRGMAKETAQYRSPFDGLVHQDAKMWTGNGLWDTYRAVWPLFTILSPEATGEMLDGLVNSYKDGGWTLRWSDPGYWECMIGTHADVIFGDAFVKGIRNWDYETGYAASLKNALLAGPGGGKGRRFVERSAFLGYVPWTGEKPDDEVGARTIEDAINDFGISRFAAALGKSDDARYFGNRAAAYANLWSPEVGFFRGKDAAGHWRTTDAAFDPFAWRYEWTEGNAWQYRFAAMHDGAGLAGLFGGRAALEAGLDEVFAASPHFGTGGYGQVIHEMLEAQTAGERGFGQFALGNEPVHHLLHMYAYAGRPAKTQYWQRRALHELFENGFSDGHGYPGDEDEGQMSAWYVMNALGFYSAAPGTAEYILGSPLFPSVTIRHDDGTSFHIEAASNDADHVYIGHADLDGQPYDWPYLNHKTLMGSGNLTLTMQTAPSHWGEREDDSPSSLTPKGETPHYAPNLAHAGVMTGSGEHAPDEILSALVDDNSRTKWLTFASQASFTAQILRPAAVNCYTMTSANDEPLRDPKAWRVYGSNDAVDWQLLDTQDDVTWANRLETKVFYLQNDNMFSYFKVEIVANGGAPALQLAEFELRELPPATH